jgi:hypothetical protein
MLGLIIMVVVWQIFRTRAAPDSTWNRGRKRSSQPGIHQWHADPSPDPQFEDPGTNWQVRECWAAIGA